MLRTTLLLGALTGLIMLIGQYFGGSQGLTIAFIFAIIMNFGSYWFSDKIVSKCTAASRPRKPTRRNSTALCTP